MPLVTINFFPPDDPKVITTMLEDIRDSGSKTLGCSPDNIWVIFQPVKSGYYIQGNEVTTQARETTHPPVVIIRAQSGRSPTEREKFAESVAAAVGRGLSVKSKNVWIHYQEMSPKDVWFDGHWSG